MANRRGLCEMFIQITGLVVTFSACHIATKYLLHHIVGILMNGTIAFILCYIVVPCIALACIIHPALAKAIRKTQLRHFKVLLFTIIEGILSGYVLSERTYHTSPPCIWFVPLGIAIAARTEAFNVGACSDKLLFVSVGLGAITELVFGIIVGITFSYLCITAIYVAIGYIAVQFYLEKYRKSRMCDRISTTLRTPHRRPEYFWCSRRSNFEQEIQNRKNDELRGLFLQQLDELYQMSYVLANVYTQLFISYAFGCRS